LCKISTLLKIDIIFKQTNPSLPFDPPCGPWYARQSTTDRAFIGVKNMGSYIAWKLDADTTGGEQFLIETANAHPEFKNEKDGPKFENFMWRKWSPEVKWWAPDFVADLSKNIDVIFRLDAKGDENFTYFFYKGQTLTESEIWERPTFPSRPLFKKKLTEAKVNRAKAKQLREEAAAKAEKERLEKEIETLKAKQHQLEKRLAG
jgi:hypothetical protein